ncbi:MAG: STAS/SEC14 domain-containing protein [Planctomycetota bacterium]
MLDHRLDEESAILTVRPEAELTKEDFERLAALVDPFIESHGTLAGLLVIAESFPGWEGLSGLVGHLRFVRDHHRSIARVAIASDAKIAETIPRLVDHFVAAEIRQFPLSDVDAARRWIAAGDDD